MNELADELERLLTLQPSAAVDFEIVEKSLKSTALQLVATLLERHLNADTSDSEERTIPCPCGGEAHYAGRRRKDFVTALDIVRLDRAYYVCAGCGSGFCPRDRQLGLDGSVSPTVRRMTGLTAGQLSFERSSELLRELAEVRLNAKRVERVAEAMGREISDDERQVIEVEPCGARTIYAGIDGTGIPMRSGECDGRKGKQADGSARTREVKAVAVWTAQSKNKKGLPMRDEGSVSYNAAIESAASGDRDALPSVFARRVEREARRRDMYQPGRRVVIIGDGAAWIWNLAGELFAERIEILDLFHAKEHLWDVAKVIFGADSDLAGQWADNRCDELERGDIETVKSALRCHAEHHEAVRKCIQYICNNEARMQYDRFRQMELCVGSGVVEAGCKSVIGQRLKQSGMFWSVEGANAIIALRCSIESNRFDDFWERRAAHTDSG